MHINKKDAPDREKIRLIWTDLEMSGLDPDSDRILEAAFIITDGNLNAVAEAPVWAVSQPDSVLDGMDDWNKRTHGESGLTDRCRHSKLTETAVQDEILRFLRKHAKPGESPMCGNSICQDRRFMARHMPAVEAFFHYRNFDVSAVKIAAYLFAPRAFRTWDKPPSRHQALDDIRDSIDEMKHYAKFLRELG